jgi:putative hydrolase of HD superfamily
MSIDRDLELLYEIGTLRFTRRQWTRFLNADFANLSEHHLRVIWTALTIAKHEKADIDKVIKLALVHDIAESRTGDVDYISRQYVDRNEKLGFTDMVKDTVLEKELEDLIKEYEARESVESKIVKDADNLDVEMELREQEFRGMTIRDGWKEMRAHVRQTKLYTKTAQKLWDKIVESNPHDWHINGRNRRAAGDWKN